VILLGNTFERIKSGITFFNIIRALVWVILALTLLSTIRFIFSPLLPSADEYIGNFPEKFGENFEMWISEILWRRIALINEYYNIGWILELLSYVFFLLLLVSVKKVLSKPLKSEELIDNYFDWAVGSILIVIVFITKFITTQNIHQIGLGVFGLTVSVFLLIYIANVIEKSK